MECQRGSGGSVCCLIHKEIKDAKQGWDLWSQAVVGRDEAEEISALEREKS